MTTIDVTPDVMRTQLWIYNVLNAISFTLLIHDYFLTLEAEVVRFWQRKNKLTAPTILFFCNRYISLLGNAPVVVMYFWYSPASPRKTEMFVIRALLERSLTLGQVIVALILIVRTYALYGRSRRILLFFAVLIPCTLAVALFGILRSLHAPDKVGSVSIYLGCVSPKGRVQSEGFLIAWGSLAVFDTVIFGMTMWWTVMEGFWGTMREGVRREMKGIYAMRIFVRDGAVYFIVIILFSIANLITFGLNDPYSRGIASVFGNIVSSVMISRLMLNLRDPALNPLHVASTHAHAHPQAKAAAAYTTGGTPAAHVVTTRTSASGLLWAVASGTETETGDLQTLGLGLVTASGASTDPDSKASRSQSSGTAAELERTHEKDEEKRVIVEIV
ncbi:hypothetical protein HMN09_00994600 [Mycena chlorophos]|uniref:DUF6533 domain-containing protein n=1 Tax=Mycena chlorophos TaxID=658473 RepID=A0A8H6W5D4_MYCCL|nr:hypothetical protein HMN09_00994600 [Mycena chlorophos]